MASEELTWNTTHWPKTEKKAGGEIKASAALLSIKS